MAALETAKNFAPIRKTIEPSVAMGKSICHAGLRSIACDVEPRRPTLDQLLFQFSAHGKQAHSGNSNLMFAVRLDAQNEPAF
jgi:hypothetical protein